VSLLRKASKSSIDYPVFGIDWQVDEFVLVESISSPQGVNYKIIEKYPCKISEPF